MTWWQGFGGAPYSYLIVIGSLLNHFGSHPKWRPDKSGFLIEGISDLTSDTEISKLYVTLLWEENVCRWKKSEVGNAIISKTTKHITCKIKFWEDHKIFVAFVINFTMHLKWTWNSATCKHLFQPFIQVCLQLYIFHAPKQELNCAHSLKISLFVQNKFWKRIFIFP